MAIKLLHTSGWHLGVRLKNVPLFEDQKRYLEWQLKVLHDEAIQILIIAGDLFHRPQPAPETEKLFFDFLKKASDVPSVRQVIAIAGSHDDAKRLDALSSLLSPLGIHLIGRPGDTPSTSVHRGLCPVRDAEGEVFAVVLAIPLLDVGSPHDASTPSAQLEIYRTLTEEASLRWPGIPLIATGYMTPSEVQDRSLLRRPAPTLDLAAFDERLAYVALGGSGKACAIEHDRSAPVIHYSGSPISLDVEADDPSSAVLCVDIEAGDPHHAEVRLLPVPPARRVCKIKGTLKEVRRTIKALNWQEALPPLLSVTLQLEEADPGAVQEVYNMIRAREDRTPPRIIDVQQEVERVVEAPSPDVSSAAQVYSLEEIFGLLLERRPRKDGDPTNEELWAAFRSLPITSSPTETS